MAGVVGTAEINCPSIPLHLNSQSQEIFAACFAAEVSLLLQRTFINPPESPTNQIFYAL